MRVGRILDKTRWTKALGEVATVLYVDCNEDIDLSKHSRAGGHETSGQYLRLTTDVQPTDATEETVG